MYEIDFDKIGFEWLVKDDNSNCVCAFKRYNKNRDYIICVCNFSPFRVTDYVIGVDESGTYEEIFSSNDEAFGGTGEYNEIIHANIMNKNGKSHAIRLNIPANTTILLKKAKKI